MTHRTIILTGRPPVTVNEETWPLVASASCEDHDGREFAHQRTYCHTYFLGARQHADGRAVVYATYDFSSIRDGVADVCERAGILLPAGTTTDGLVEGIKQVAGMMQDDIPDYMSHAQGGWRKVLRECLASMPAEVLD